METKTKTVKAMYYDNGEKYDVTYIPRCLIIRRHDYLSSTTPYPHFDAEGYISEDYIRNRPIVNASEIVKSII